MQPRKGSKLVKSVGLIFAKLCCGLFRSRWPSSQTFYPLKDALLCFTLL